MAIDALSQSDESGVQRHIPVLLDEVVDVLRPQKGAWILDGTFGFGGYSEALLAMGANVLAVDRDPEAKARAEDFKARYGDRFRFVSGCFGVLDEIAEAEGLVPDGIVLDIGVSSMQLDDSERGFSFMNDGPLDMRMSQDGLSAADIVNSFEEGDLSRIFFELGEEKQARRIAKVLIAQRRITPFSRTSELADLIEKTVGRKPQQKIHPATRVFQALRIFVNGELDELIDALFAAEKCLKPEGKLAIVTFHSLEDRIVKRFFAERSKTKAGGSRYLPEQAVRPASFEMLIRGAVSSGEEELVRNPRARSAKLRAGKRLESAPHAFDARGLGLPGILAEKRSGGRT